MEGARRLNYQNESYESWLYIFGKSLDRVDEKIDGGLDNQRARLRYMVSLSRRLLTPEQYKEYREVARSGSLDELYDLLASLTLRANKEWTWQEEEIEELVVPGNSLQPGP